MEDILYHSSTNVNPLGKIVSGCAYFADVTPFSQWSRCLQWTCREAHEAYHSFYRLKMPIYAGPALRLEGTEQDDSRVGIFIPSETDCEWFTWGALELNPDTDIIQLKCDVDGRNRMPLEPKRDEWEYFMDYDHEYILDFKENYHMFSIGSALAAFFYDAWAWDPKGTGLTRLATDQIDELCVGVQETARKFGQAAENGFRGWLSGFSHDDEQLEGTRSTSKNNCIYAIVRMRVEGARHDNIPPSSPFDNDDGVPVSLRRAVPVMPEIPGRSRPAVVAAFFEPEECNDGIGSDSRGGDPRPLETDKYLVGSSSRLDIRGWDTSPLFYWRRLLHIFGLEADLDTKAGYLAAIWSLERCHEHEPGYDRDNFIDLLRDEDEAQLEQFDMMHRNGGDWSADRRDRMVRELTSLLKTEQPALRDVAGAWIFRSDALGEIPADTDTEHPYMNIVTAWENSDNRLICEETRINLEKHRPGLMVFQLENEREPSLDLE